MTTQSLKQKKPLGPTGDEIRGAALVAHIEAQLAYSEPQKRLEKDFQATS